MAEPRTFHLFPRLPAELRLMIWHYALPGPRLIDRESKYRTLPNPSMLSVNTEARRVALKWYHWLEDTVPEGSDRMLHTGFYVDLERDIILHRNFDMPEPGPERNVCLYEHMVTPIIRDVEAEYESAQRDWEPDFVPTCEGVDFMCVKVGFKNLKELYTLPENPAKTRHRRLLGRRLRQGDVELCGELHLRYREDWNEEYGACEMCGAEDHMWIYDAGYGPYKRLHDESKVNHRR